MISASVKLRSSAGQVRAEMSGSSAGQVRARCGSSSCGNVRVKCGSSSRGNVRVKCGSSYGQVRVELVTSSPRDVEARVSQARLKLIPGPCRKTTMGEPIRRCSTRHPLGISPVGVGCHILVKPEGEADWDHDGGAPGYVDCPQAGPPSSLGGRFRCRR